MKGGKTPSFLSIYYHKFAFNATLLYNILMEQNQSHAFICGAEDGRALQIFITDTHLVLDVFDKEGEHLRNVTQTFAEWLDELTPSPNPQIIEPVNDFL